MSRSQSWAKRFGPSCLAQAVSTSPTASPITHTTLAAWGQGGALGAQVVGIRSPLEAVPRRSSSPSS
jgi:hypothetical protein